MPCSAPLPAQNSLSQISGSKMTPYKRRTSLLDISLWQKPSVARPKSVPLTPFPGPTLKLVVRRATL